MYVFFFQAEDGIRDIGVTGVQTCALPIFFLLASSICFAKEKNRVGFLTNLQELKEISDIMDIVNENYVDTGEHEFSRKTLMQGALKGMVESLEDPHSTYFTKAELESFEEDVRGKYVGVGRSEERRVGKE